MPNKNERLSGEITFNLSVSLDNVDADQTILLQDLQRTFARAVSANERFLPKGVNLEELFIEFVDIYTVDDDDRYMDYLMATDPRV